MCLYYDCFTKCIIRIRTSFDIHLLSFNVRRPIRVISIYRLSRGTSVQVLCSTFHWSFPRVSCKARSFHKLRLDLRSTAKSLASDFPTQTPKKWIAFERYPDDWAGGPGSVYANPEFLAERCNPSGWTGHGLGFPFVGWSSVPERRTLSWRAWRDKPHPVPIRYTEPELLDGTARPAPDSRRDPDASACPSVNS